jgi:tRNA (cytidine/uridine-2'-O-)-methyltransferase
MFHVVLVEPQIPPNTGNVIRLCANAGAALHLVEPLGFALDHAKMRRAGLDYHEFTRLSVHRDFDALVTDLRPDPARMFAFSTRAAATLAGARFAPGDWFVFGSETKGLSQDLLARMKAANVLRIPMRPDNRSLNLSNAVAVVVFEAWRQAGFAGGL